MKLLSKIVSSVLTLTISLTALMAMPVTVKAANSQITLSGGWYETMYAEWNNESNINKAKVEYKLSDSKDYITVDSELIRAKGGGSARVDILGIAGGNYDLKITTGTGEVIEKQGIKVAMEDRSGYAHFGYGSGVGAYNNDGTPKTNADIIYVTNDNKNTVSYGGYTGIAKILSNKKNISNPLIVRIIGTIDTQTRDSDGTKTTDINNGVVAISGLTDRAMSDDSYFNMCDINGAKNLTIEGVGTDATILKWGLMFSSSSESIEVKNITFDKYPEDACSAQNSSRIWIHRSVYNQGENKYDLTTEQDKHEGDGSTDINQCKNITISYCKYYNTHKSSLNGGSDSTKQYNYTYHHNYFLECGSRLPLTRYVNVHLYNNYYSGVSSGISSRASAWVFSESNYFENSRNIYGTVSSSSYGNGTIKAYNDVLENSTFSNAPYLNQTTDRTATYTVSGNYNPTPNYDTNSEVFYYDNENQVTKVTYLTDAYQAKTDALIGAGVMTDGQTLIEFGDTVVVNPTPTETTEATTETPTEVTTVEIKTPEAGITALDEGATANGVNTVTYDSSRDMYYIYDTSSNATTTWTVPFDAQTSGKIVIKGTFKPSRKATKWTVVQVQDSSGNTVCGIRSDTNSTLGIVTMGASDVSASTGITLNGDEGYSYEYTYKFVIDLDNQTAEITVNGEKATAAIRATDISSVYFMTAKTDNTRHLYASMPSVAKVVEASAYDMGDVNMDGKVTSVDATLALLNSANRNKLSDEALALADVTGDGKVTSADATSILLKASKG